MFICLFHSSWSVCGSDSHKKKKLTKKSYLDNILFRTVELNISYNILIDIVKILCMHGTHSKIPTISHQIRVTFRQRREKGYTGLFLVGILFLLWNYSIIWRKSQIRRTGKSMATLRGVVWEGGGPERGRSRGLMLPCLATSEAHFDWQSPMHGPAYSTGNNTYIPVWA